MAGYVIYNGFWNPTTPPDPVRRLADAAAKRHIHLTPLPNTRLIAAMEPTLRIRVLPENGADKNAADSLSAADFALFWDKDLRLARAMEACGIRLYNTADAVALCDDKAATHRVLAANGVPMPRTLIAPMTYVHVGAPVEPFLQYAAQELGFPMVLKECFGSLGGQVYRADDFKALRRLAYRMESRPFLAQQYIAASAGTDFRLYVVGGQVVAAMKRHCTHDFRANIGNGGHGDAYTPTAQEEELALRCCRLLGTEFAGVVLLRDEHGQPLVCEVNSNAYMQAITACTGVDVAGAILDYVLEQEQQRPCSGLYGALIANS